MEERDLARGLINKFKLLKEPGHTELITIPLKFGELRKPLKRYFKSISPRHAGDIRCQIIIENGYNDYDREYLEVIGLIGKILGVSIYMKEILEGDILIPQKRLYICGQATEVSITAHIARYLYKSFEAIIEVVSKSRPKKENANKYLTRIRKEFFGNIIQNTLGELEVLPTYKARILHPDTLKLKERLVLEYMLKTFIFDFDEKNENPIYGEIKPTTLDGFKIQGKWVNKHLLTWGLTKNTGKQ